MRAAVLQTLALDTKRVLVDSQQPLIGDDLVGLALSCQGGEVCPQHQGRLHQAPKREHCTVFLVRHPTLTNKQAIRVVPARTWSLNSFLPVPNFIIHINVPQHALPSISDILRSSPKMTKTSSKSLHITKAPGTPC